MKENMNNFDDKLSRRLQWSKKKGSKSFKQNSQFKVKEPYKRNKSISYSDEQ